VNLSNEEIVNRRAEWKMPKKEVPGKWLKMYSILASNASLGAVLKTEL